MAKQKMSDKKQQDIVNVLIKSIEDNPAEWEKGWYSPRKNFNGDTMNYYHGVNVLFLDVIGRQKGFRSHCWVTYKQAQNIGGNVKKGEESHAPVFFWRRYDKNTKKDFSSSTIKDMSAEDQQVYLNENVRNIISWSQVFNIEQCENIPEAKLKLFEETKMSAEEQAKCNLQAERIISNSEAPVIYDQQDKNFYNVTKDEVHLTDVESFKTMKDYYATALHEIAHSTGHSSRLNRELSGRGNKEEYALEELRAELASVFLQNETGINLEGAEIENHGAYLKSWLSAVKDDYKEFYRAASDATKISNYIIENYNVDEKTEVKEKPVLSQEEFLAQNEPTTLEMLVANMPDIEPAKKEAKTEAVMENSKG